MLLNRVILGTLMVTALVGLVALDMWLSTDVPEGPSCTKFPNGQFGFAYAVLNSYGWSALRLSGLPTVLVAVALAGLAVYELGSILSVKDYRPAKYWAIFAAILLVVMPWLELRFSWSFASETASLMDSCSFSLMCLIAGVIGSAVAIMKRGHTERATMALAVTIFMFTYIGLLGSFLIRIRCFLPGPAGAALLLYCILTIKATDIGAYLTGRAIGKHLLAPKISPKKTIEGFVGGLVLACLTAVGGIWLWTQILPEWMGPLPLTSTQAIILAMLTSFSGHLGDLAESAIKRDVGLKDSGRAVASFGGFLDVLDSLLFAAPVAWWWLTLCA